MVDRGGEETSCDDHHQRHFLAFVSADADGREEVRPEAPDLSAVVVFAVVREGERERRLRPLALFSFRSFTNSPFPPASLALLSCRAPVPAHTHLREGVKSWARRRGGGAG